MQPARTPLRHIGPLSLTVLSKSVLRSLGCKGKRFGRRVADTGFSKLNPGEITPCGMKTANTFCQGPVAGNCKVAEQVCVVARGTVAAGGSPPQQVGRPGGDGGDALREARQRLR